ncbi:hypothetical protein ACL58G_10765 [Massilia sp. GER05]|uniref:hypothetical protein n=1 Tax=Massilia sp. GER05 TaxID=3394605 RepID=UPI003F85C48B
MAARFPIAPIIKLVILEDGTCNGQLVVVRDLKTAHIADGIAPTLQAAFDDWRFIAPQLAMLYADLNAGRVCRPFDFDHGRCMRRCRALSTGRRYRLPEGCKEDGRAAEAPSRQRRTA